MSNVVKVNMRTLELLCYIDIHTYKFQLTITTVCVSVSESVIVYACVKSNYEMIVILQIIFWLGLMVYLAG